MSAEEKSNAQSSKHKYPSCLSNLSYYFTEYCGNASIHGLKFLGERGRSPIEKVWWLTCISTSLYFCIILNISVYRKWVNSPVVVTFATTQTPIWKIPFPSVTICPEVKSKKNYYNFTQELLSRKNFSADQRSKFDHISLVCPILFGLLILPDSVEFTDETALDFLMEISPNFDDIILLSRWLGQNITSDAFKPIITSEGICYVFNLLNRNELFTDAMDHYRNFGLMTENKSQWSLEEGYEKDAELDTYPRRTPLSGSNGGIDLLLSTRVEDVDWLCGDALQGYKVILQHPAQLPNADQQYFRVPLNQDVAAIVKPNMMTTSGDLLDYTPEDRQCYFLTERNLRFFQLYNQQNCLIECLANFTLNRCECVAFYMPRDNSTPICGPAMAGCIAEANHAFLSQEIVQKLKTAHVKKKKHFRKLNKESANEHCNCLPSCTSLEFDIEISQTDWKWWTPVTVLNITKELENVHLSRVRIFFKDMQFITSERNELYGQTDFWANCGGLLGLFTGFSFISTAEVLYYATLRLVCNLRKFGRHYWSGAQELLEESNNQQQQ